MNDKGKASLKRLNSYLNDNAVDVVGVGKVGFVLGVTRDRVHKLIRTKRLKAEKGLGLNPCYEIKVEDLREFIQNDFGKAEPGRPKLGVVVKGTRS